MDTDALIAAVKLIGMGVVSDELVLIHNGNIIILAKLVCTDSGWQWQLPSKVSAEVSNNDDLDDMPF